MKKTYIHPTTAVFNTCPECVMTGTSGVGTFAYEDDLIQKATLLIYLDEEDDLDDEKNGRRRR